MSQQYVTPISNRTHAVVKSRLLTTLVLLLTFFALPAFAQHKGIGFQATLKKPDGTYASAVGVAVTLQVLDPVTDCVLREELHSGVPVVNGYIHLVLGSGTATTPAGRNPTPILSIAEVMDNTTTRTGLNCVDTTNAIVSTGQSYIPAATHARKLRLRATIAGDPIVADFNMRAIGFAVNAENLDGKAASAFVQTSPSTTQANVESIFSRYNVLDAILNGTYAGNAATATALAVAPGACPAGQYLSAMSANGTITCGTPTGGAGTVTAVSSANSYLSVATGTTTPVLTLNVGTAANTVAAGNDSRFTDSRAPNGAAGGDLSGTYPNPTVAKIAGKSVVLTTPANGEVLKYDGTNFVNASGADATKLPLAGGTMTGAIDMNSQNLTNLGFVTMSANKNLHLSNNASDPSGLVAADKGKIWFNSTSGEIKYWNGSAAQSLGVAGSGLANFNTQTGTTQTLAIGTSGTAPAWNSASNTHTLNIPMASTASVTAGLLSKTDYDAFNAKLGTATAFSGDVTGTYGATSVDKIKGKSIAATTYAAGQTLRYDGTDWINSVLNFEDLGSKPTTLAGYGITDAQSSTLANGKILVGDGSNVATAVTMSGDATLSNTGALTLGTVPMSKGGTGVTSFTGDRVITTSAAGALQATSCGLNQVISFTAGGAITCASVSSLSGGFANGGNSFGGAAVLGTDDSNTLSFETAGTNKMTILTNGNVGIGNTTPAARIDVQWNSSATVGDVYGARVVVNQSPTANSTSNVFGILSETTFDENINGYTGAALTSIKGVAKRTGFSSGPTSLTGLHGQAIGSSGTPITDAHGVYGSVGSSATANMIVNGYGGYFSAPGGGANSITNSYGVYIGSVAGSTTKHSLYASDANAPSYFAGNVGIGATVPTSTLDLGGAITQRGTSAPAVSPAGQGRIYFDTTANKFKASQNGGAYVDLVSSGGGVGGTGTTNAIPRFTASASLGDSGLSDNGSTITASRAVVTTPTGIPSGATINLSTSNTHLLSSVGGSTITLQNLVHGGEYNIIIADTTSRTYTFSGCTNSYFKPANAATTNGTQTIYGLLIYQSGSDYNCYFTWSSGFQ